MKYAVQMDLDIELDVSWHSAANQRYGNIPAEGVFLAPTKEEWCDNEVVGAAYSLAAMYHFMGMNDQVSSDGLTPEIIMYFGVDTEGQVAMGNKDDYEFAKNVNLGKIVATVSEDWK